MRSEAAEDRLPVAMLLCLHRGGVSGWRHVVAGCGDGGCSGGGCGGCSGGRCVRL